MVVKIYISKAEGAGNIKMRTDFKRESEDTPRITNFGLDIKESIDRIIERCEDAGEVQA